MASTGTNTGMPRANEKNAAGAGREPPRPRVLVLLPGPVRGALPARDSGPLGGGAADRVPPARRCYRQRQGERSIGGGYRGRFCCKFCKLKGGLCSGGVMVGLSEEGLQV